MGCAASRFDSRNKNSQDLNTVALQFVGGTDHVFDGCPVDKVNLACIVDDKDEIKVEADMKGGDEAQTTKLYKSAVSLLDKQLKTLNDKYGSSSDNKTAYIDGKYKAEDAIAQLTAARAFFEEKCKIKMDDKAEAAPADGMMMEENKDGMMAEAEVMMEGGDEMMAEMMAATASPHKYEDDARAYDGWADVPGAFLKQMIVSPYWGDLVKKEALSWEFNPKDGKVPDIFGSMIDVVGKVDFISGAPPSYKGAAALVGAAVAKAQVDSAAAIFFSGHVGEEDFKSLEDIVASEGKDIHFPFLTMGWATKQEALDALKLEDASNGKQKTKMVLFEVSGAKALNWVGCRHVCHRLTGTLEKDAVEEEVNSFKVTGKYPTESTTEDWLKLYEMNPLKFMTQYKKRDVKEEAPAAAAPADGMMMEENKDGMMMEPEMMAEAME